MFRCPHIGLWLESRSNTDENLSCSCNLRTTTESEIWFILWTRVPDGMQTQTTTICLHILNTARYVVAKLWFFFRMYLWFSCLQQICRTEFINYLNWQNNPDMWSVSSVLKNTKHNSLHCHKWLFWNTHQRGEKLCDTVCMLPVCERSILSEVGRNWSHIYAWGWHCLCDL